MIDIGEALLAVIGIRPVISRKVERVTAEQWREARALQSRIRLLASKLVRGEGEGVTELGEPVNYDRTLKELSEPPDTGQLMAMIASFPPEAHDAASAFLFAAGRAYDYLRGKFPISTERHLVGADNLPPGDMAMASFEFLLEIVDRPMSVFDLLDTGALLGSQAQAFATCYPSIQSAVLLAIDDRVAREVTRTPSYEPHFRFAFSTLMGAPKIDPRTSAALGAAKVDDQAKKQAARQQPPGSQAAEQIAPPSSQPPPE